MPVGRDELNRWARVAFLVVYPFWTLYKIIHHYSLWLHGTTPADRANHGLRAAAWAIMALIILISLRSTWFRKGTSSKIS